MGRRRDGREAAAQFLFSRDLNEGSDAGERDAFWELRAAKTSTKEFANTLIAGTLQHLDQIDTLLVTAAENFDLDRFSTIDRSILRLAVYELAFCPDVPDPVAIDEAIEIAKRFGTEDSARFVNGVLDRVHREIAADRPAVAPPTPED